MSDKKPKQERISAVPPFGLRMLPEIRLRVEMAAAANNRSLNAEIIARLELSFRYEEDIKLENQALKDVSGYWQNQMAHVQSELEFANAYRSNLQRRLLVLKRDISSVEESRKALTKPASAEDPEDENQ